jgi:hypothetical protein
MDVLGDIFRMSWSIAIAFWHKIDGCRSRVVSNAHKGLPFGPDNCLGHKLFDKIYKLKVRGKIFKLNLGEFEWAASSRRACQQYLF